MAFADSEGLQIYYDDTGEGELALLCLPGFTNDHTIFAPLVARLSADHRVLVIDWRGHGKSQAPDVDFDFAEMVGDAFAGIRDSGACSVIPIGQGQLPWVGVELRRRLGERVPKMVASSWPVISARGNPLAPGFLAAMEAVQDETRWRETAEQVVTMFVGGAPTSVQEQIRNQMLSHGYEMWPRAGREITLGRPWALETGRWASMQDHSVLERSVCYALLMLATLASYLLKTPFRTVSLRGGMNRCNNRGRSITPRHSWAMGGLRWY